MTIGGDNGYLHLQTCGGEGLVCPQDRDTERTIRKGRASPRLQACYQDRVFDAQPFPWRHNRDFSRHASDPIATYWTRRFVASDFAELNRVTDPAQPGARRPEPSCERPTSRAAPHPRARHRGGKPDRPLVHRAPKYGTDHPIVGENARKLVSHLYTAYQSKTNYRTGLYRPAYWTMTNHAGQGELAGALPNGRKKGKVLASGITPVSQAAVNLPDCLDSVAALDANQIPRTPLIPGITDSDENLQQIAAFLAGFGIIDWVKLPFNPAFSEKWEWVGWTPGEMQPENSRMS